MMKKLWRRLFLLITSVAIVILNRYPPTANADRPETQVTQGEDKTSERVDVRYARAYVRLAKLDLRRVTDANERVSGMYSAAMVDKLRHHVAIAEDELQQCLKGKEAQLHEVHIRSAEAAVKIAQAEVIRKRSLHEKMPRVFSSLEVARARAAEQVAKLSLEKARDPKITDSPVAHLQWQVEDLRKQVLELQLQVEKLSSQK